MTIAMTGVSGYLGGTLAAHWQHRGHAVSPISARLGAPVDPTEISGSQILVHCAHDFHRGAEELNVSGSRLLHEAASGLRMIFISSHSARPDTQSRYGITKYRVEQIFVNECIVRPGLVLGSGGLSERNIGRLDRSSIVPLVDASTSHLALIG